MDRREAPESIYEALKRLVEMLGGAKVVGHRMRPEKSPLDARVWLLNCLNDDRPEKLDPAQVMLLLRWAHEAGYHDAMNYVCSESGYTNPAPRTPEDALADLQKQALAAAERAEKLIAQMRAAHANVDGVTA